MIEVLRGYLSGTKTDWNYITPSEYYHNYYKTKKRHILIDLRKPDVFKKGHIRGAKNIFWLDLLESKNIKKFEKYRNDKIFLICYVGHTSSQAMVLLKLLGFDVTSIKFGYGISPTFEVPVAGWTQYNYPMHKST